MAQGIAHIQYDPIQHQTDADRHRAKEAPKPALALAQFFLDELALALGFQVIEGKGNIAGRFFKQAHFLSLEHIRRRGVDHERRAELALKSDGDGRRRLQPVLTGALTPRGGAGVVEVRGVPRTKRQSD